MSYGEHNRKISAIFAWNDTWYKVFLTALVDRCNIILGLRIIFEGLTKDGVTSIKSHRSIL